MWNGDYVELSEVKMTFRSFLFIMYYFCSYYGQEQMVCEIQRQYTMLLQANAFKGSMLQIDYYYQNTIFRVSDQAFYWNKIFSYLLGAL